MPKNLVFDIEANGLEPDKIYCMAWNNGAERGSTTDYKEMIKLIESHDSLIGHNIIRFDIPVLEKILGIEIKNNLIDTLALSWYLYPERPQHGLEKWGEFFGVPKPVVEDWDNLPIETYIERCEEDVKINKKLWRKQQVDLGNVYDDKSKMKEFVRYLMFKMNCARIQERDRWKLDIERTTKALEDLTAIQTERKEGLMKVMPKVDKIAIRTPPSRPFKKDGTLSVAGSRWQHLLQEHGFHHSYKGAIKEVVAQEEPNPNSVMQLKEWLFSLGWSPRTFKFDRDKTTGNIRKIPQINSDEEEGVCASIKQLAKVEPGVLFLDSLSIVNHRINILKGFLESVSEDGYLKAQIGGLTNTLRFKHKTVVNLPKVGKLFADDIRRSLVADDGYELCGSDQSSLEDRLKQHYIYPYDPDYVNEMLSDDYDPHLSLAVMAKAITEQQMEDYKSGKDKSIKPVRDTYKSGNYACQYGSGPYRLSLTANITESLAKKVHTAYWEKNWAIKEVSKNQTVKTVGDQMWLQNPINGFWYSLRYEKDIFSTLVQGSASYVFDVWVQHVLEKRNQLTAQFHDEIVLHVKQGHRKKCEKLLLDALDKTNKQLKLNRNLAIDVQFGVNYAEIH